MKLSYTILVLSILLLIASFLIPTSSLWINFLDSHYIIQQNIIFRAIAIALIILAALIYQKQKLKNRKLIK